MLAAGRLLIDDDIGLCETAQSIVTAQVLSASGCAQRGLIETPASLKQQWVRVWNLSTGTPVAIVEGGPEAPAGQYRECESGYFATDAGGVGLNLQRAASCCVNLDLPWNPAVLEQRIGRIYRLGEPHLIDVHNLVSQGCIEERILKLVADKRAFFRDLFDGASDEVVFERSASFLDTASRLVAAPASAAATFPAGEDSLFEDLEPRGDDVALATDACVPGTDDSGSGPGAASAGTASLPTAARSATGPSTASPEGSMVPGASPSAGPLPDQSFTSLFIRLVVRRTTTGGLSHEADPEDAATLAFVFKGLAG